MVLLRKHKGIITHIIIPTTRTPEAVHRHYGSLLPGLSGREKRREGREEEVHVRDCLEQMQKTDRKDK